MITKTPIVGYAPDADPATPGVLTDCISIVPTLNGVAGAPSAVSAGLSALAAACTGAASLLKLDATSRLFAGTSTKLYEDVSGTWTDRTRASGGDYSAAVRWSFGQFGNVSLAVTKSDNPQYSITGAFADLSGAPKASYVETAANFVILADYNDGTDTPNGVYWSAIGDYTDWTPSIATQCGFVSLNDTSGRNIGIKRFGRNVIIYKQRSMYLGVYVGAPTVWDFSLISGETGAASNYCIVDVGTSDDPRHIFMGYEDFYSFDGSRPIPLGTNVIKETVFGELNKTYANATFAMHDRINSRVYFFYPTSASVTPNKCVVYNYRSNKWGRDDRSVEAVLEYISAGTTYDDLGTLYSTYADLPSVSYDSGIWSGGYPIPAYFDTSHVLQTLTGASTTSQITTGDIGDDSTQMLISRVKPRFQTAPTSATMTNYYRYNLGDSLTTDTTVNMSSSRFDVLREARWHRFNLAFSGPVELTGLVFDAQASGSE